MGGLLYRHRGWVPVPVLIYALIAAERHFAGVAAGLVLVVAGEGIRLWGAAHLGLTARSSRPRAAKLVTSGPFAFTRHPLYWGNGCLVLGVSLVSGAGWFWFPVLVTALYGALYAGHARREEVALEASFPGAHAVYRAAVPAWRWRLTPARVPGGGERGSPSLRQALRVEALTLNAEFWVLVALFWRLSHRPESG